MNGGLSPAADETARIDTGDWNDLVLDKRVPARFFYANYHGHKAR